MERILLLEDDKSLVTGLAAGWLRPCWRQNVRRGPCARRCACCCCWGCLCC